MDELHEKIKKIMFDPSVFGKLSDGQKDAVLDIHYDIVNKDAVNMVPDCIKGLVNKM